MTTVLESDEGPTYDELSESSAVPLKPSKSPVKVIEVKQEEVKKEDVKKADVRKIDAKKVRKIDDFAKSFRLQLYTPRYPYFNVLVTLSLKST